MKSPSFHWSKDDDDEMLRERRSRLDPSRETAIKYCLHCEWEVRAADGYTRPERSERAVKHHVATGHTVDSIR